MDAAHEYENSYPAGMISPARDHPDVLRDESRKLGYADGAAWPTRIGEVIALMREAHSKDMPITFQGSRTGVAGGAVPEGGLVINLARLENIGPLRNDPREGVLLKVQAGFPLYALKRWIARHAPNHFFAPDPTDESASIGGMAACNASGARGFVYGSVRRHIHAITAVLADGSVTTLTRGRDRAHAYDFQILDTAGCVAVSGTLPRYDLPRVKNAAGYRVAPDMDLVDLFIGSDGTLGAIVELELRLLPKPSVCWGLMCFSESEAAILDLADLLRESAANPSALEYLDGHSLDLIRGWRISNTHIPEPPPSARAALYIELMMEAEAAAEASLAVVEECIGRAGCSSDNAWFATDARELKRFKDFRHAVPEAVNAVVDEHRRACPGITKISTDFALPPAAFRDFVARQCADSATAGLRYAVFGHVGDCHVHVNLMPRTLAQRDSAWELFHAWAREVAALGGSVAAEHGLGKLKANLLPLVCGELAAAEMLALKRAFDPGLRLGRGTLFAQA